MAQLVLPRVQAMVICDTVVESKDEIGVFHLSGVRSKLEVAGFPALQPRLCVFVQMSGHQGEAQCRVGVRHSETDSLIYRTRPKVIAFEDPTVVMPVIFQLRNCVFSEAGLYYVEILDDKKIIGERRLLVQSEE